MLNKKMNGGEWIGTFLVFLAAIISGISVVVNKFFIVEIDPLLFTAIRSFFIGLAFLFISLCFSIVDKKKFKKISWKYLFLIGTIGGGIAFWLFFTGLKLTTSGRAAFLHKTLHIYAIILGFIFLKENISKRQLVAIGIMLLGLILIELTKISSSIRIGDAFILGATILWAIENTISKNAMSNKESNWIITFGRMFFGALFLFAIIFILGKLDLLLLLNFQQILYIIVSGILLFFYVLTWYWGLRYINLSKASMILLISPVISLFLGIFWLNEKVFVLQLFGSLFILIGAGLIIGVESKKR